MKRHTLASEGSWAMLREAHELTEGGQRSIRRAIARVSRPTRDALQHNEGVNGTQAPAEIFMGPLTVTWKINGLADAADTLLLEMLNNTQPSVDLTMTQSTSAILQVHSTQVAFTAAPFKNDKEVIEIDATGTAIANTTDIGASGGYSPVKVTLTNAVDGGYV